MNDKSMLKSACKLLHDLEDVTRVLGTETRGRLRQLRVSAVEECVIIHGETDTYFIKQLVNVVLDNTFPEIVFRNSVEVVGLRS